MSVFATDWSFFFYEIDKFHGAIHEREYIWTIKVVRNIFLGKHGYFVCSRCSSHIHAYFVCNIIKIEMDALHRNSYTQGVFWEL